MTGQRNPVTAPQEWPDRYEPDCSTRCPAVSGAPQEPGAEFRLTPLPQHDQDVPCSRWSAPAWSEGACPRLAAGWLAARGGIGIPAKLLVARPDSPPRADQAGAWTRADEWLGREGPAHLVVRGAPGVGKSFLASRLAQAVVPDLIARWVEVAMFDPIRAEDELEKWTLAGLLVLNDLGCEWNKTGGTYCENRLDALIRMVDANGGRVVVTTNLPAKAMADRYSAAMVDRLVSDGCPLVIAGATQRGRQQNAT